MAISEIPSLHLKPVAYKTNKLYLKLPEGSIGNMTFARTSIARRDNNSGLVEEVATGIPRLDYPLINGVVQSCPELLLEPTTTNLCLRSEEIDNATWLKTSSGTGVTPIVTANASISPDGTKSADRVKFDSGSAGNSQLQQASIGSAVDNTFSFYLKSLSGDVVLTIFTGGSNTNVTVTSDWKRFVITSSVVTADVRFAKRDIWNSTGTADILIWGTQVEDLKYATSYIKTEGSTVTRATEALNNGGDATTFNSSEGVLYVEMSALFNDLTTRDISINDGSTANRVMIAYSSTTNQLKLDIFSATVSQVLLTHTLSDETVFIKVAVKWKLNDAALWVDGVEVATESSATMPIGLNNFSFDHSSNLFFFGNIRELKVYKTALTDIELEELTI